MIVLTDNKHYTDIANAIRSKAVSTKTYTPSQMASAIEDVYASGYGSGNADGVARGRDEGYERGYKSGKEDEYNSFWDALQNYGSRTNYSYMFQNSAFEYIDTKYPIIDTSLSVTFNNSKNLKGILCDVVPLNGAFSTLYIAFAGCEKLEEIVFDLPVSGNASAFNSTFITCQKLKTIQKIILDGGTYNFTAAFDYCNALENITFEGDIKATASIGFPQSKVLSNASVQNIIDHLFNYTGDTTRTLIFHTDVKAKMTDTQIAQITAKNWTLA